MKGLSNQSLFKIKVALMFNLILILNKDRKTNNICWLIIILKPFTYFIHNYYFNLLFENFIMHIIHFGQIHPLTKSTTFPL